MPTTPPRFPLAPLIEQLGCPVEGEGSVRPTARLLGVSPNKLLRMRESGIRWAEADTMAVKLLGLNPVNVWREWDQYVPGEPDDEVDDEVDMEVSV